MGTGVSEEIGAIIEGRSGKSILQILLENGRMGEMPALPWFGTKGLALMQSWSKVCEGLPVGVRLTGRWYDVGNGDIIWEGEYD